MTLSKVTLHFRNSAKLIAGFLFLSAASVALASPVKFDISSQPAPSALLLFIKQGKVQVAYSAEDLQNVMANSVTGDFEPGDALDLLLKDTGFAGTERKPGYYTVVRVKSKQSATGLIRGNLARENGAPAEGVKVMINETGQQARTDKGGEYIFGSVEPGTYVLVITAEGYQPLHITDVVVKAGNELTLSREDMRLADSTLKLDPLVVKAESVTQLEKLEVTGSKQKPFTTANMDIPRTIDDVQPYYIFDSKTIDQSGAINVENFLKDRLTMNATAQTKSQVSGANTSGNTSSINLRGLGTDETLILINGRRAAGVYILGTDYQTDLNGIPMSAIDRIEVLPSSASGIYGGSAIGGVINIILKKDYSGGEIRATYDNAWNADAPKRTLSASYGLSLEGGKTHLLLNASWSDAQPLLLQDRRGAYEQNLATLLTNSPTWIYSARNPWLGALPNITPSTSSQTTLTLKNGVVLPSRNTYIAAGTSANTSSSDLYATLAANAGSWNLDLPASTQSPTGLLQPFGATPETKSLMASVRRQMLPKLEVFADFAYNENNTKSVYSPYTSYLTVPVDSPVNPFTTAVRVRVPDSAQVPVITRSESRIYTAGAIAQLPWNWTAEFDYSWSESRFRYVWYDYDRPSLAADLKSGTLNPFVDTLLYPLSLQKYLAPYSYSGSSTLNDLALRGSGPLWSLPWGTPSLTLGLEHRIAATPDTIFERSYPLTTDDSLRETFFRQQQQTDSGYGELTIPLVKKDWLPLVHALDLQLSGRGERYAVDTGTPSATYFPNTGATVYNSPTLNGQPYFSKTTYASINGTIGLKYQPVSEVTLRASLASAFLPPTPDQLIKNPEVDTGLTTVIDPKTSNSIDVQTISGGNPDLKPQSAKSLNAGIIWEPTWKLLKGLRLDAEYYRIKQDNAIGYLSAQQIVSLENLYPDRLTRDSAGAITLVDTSYVNLYKRETEGWDLSGDYTFKTSVGTFNLRAAESIILHLKNQYDQTLPEFDAVNYPSDGGAAKYKTNATLSWEWRNWTAGWSTRYFSSYKQYGAAGGPTSVQSYGGAVYNYYILAQGSDTIPSQTYHDLFIGYTFGSRQSVSGPKLRALGNTLLSDLTVQLGVRNIFNKVPPFDAYYSSNYYLSPYGDMRLRSYWLSVKKAF